MHTHTHTHTPHTHTHTHTPSDLPFLPSQTLATAHLPGALGLLMSNKDRLRKKGSTVLTELMESFFLRSDADR